MKNKGFTLIELLTVIIILSFILILAVPKVIGVLDSVKDESFKSLAHIAVGNAKAYVSINQNFEAPSEADKVKLITFTELEIEYDKTSYESAINLDNSYVLIDENSKYYVTITTDVDEKGIKHLISTEIDSDTLPIITFTSSGDLSVPDVSSYTLEGTDLNLDTDGDGLLDDKVVKIVEIRD